MSAPAPSAILIIGGGVFGLSTAYALTQRAKYAQTKITLLDRHPSVPLSHLSTTSSVDTTRIIRADYADPAYAQLAREAQDLWRTSTWGGEGRYHESGMCLTTKAGREGYVKKSLENVLALEGSKDCGNGKIRELPNAADIAEAMRAGSAARGTGEHGYVNPHSGWADPEACMRWLWAKVQSSGRIDFVAGEAIRLVLSPTKEEVTGAILTTGETLSADVTILATGAWTGQFIDIRGVASARGMCVGYMDLGEDEAGALKDMPVHYNMGNGLYFFPPGNGRNEIKVAKHAYGYSNPTEIPAPLGASTDKITISLPTFPSSGIPESDKEELEEFLHVALPILSKGTSKTRKIRRSRLCWYLDTKSSDYLICPYPVSSVLSSSTAPKKPNGLTFPSLFLATGGSGHGFKFLPNLGHRIIDVLDGTDVAENGGTWTKKWGWPGVSGTKRTGAAGLDGDVVDRTSDDEVWCLDGSRSGPIGLILADALESGKVKSKL